MRVRTYFDLKDYIYIERWVNSERVHSLWCADLIPYPMTRESFAKVLEEIAVKWDGHAYVVTEENGTPIGFFVYSVKALNNSGFLQFVILNSQMRGKGYGAQMLKLVLKFAFDITGVSSIHLNVFDVNTHAIKCYSKIGFVEKSVEKNVFSYKNEKWGRCNMSVSK